MHNLEKEHCTSNGEAGFLSVSKVNMWHFTRAPIFLCEITSSISAAPEIAEGRHLCLLLNFFGSLKEKLSIKPLLTPKKNSVNGDRRFSKVRKISKTQLFRKARKLNSLISHRICI